MEANETVLQEEFEMIENMGMNLTFIEPISHGGELIQCIDKIDIEFEINMFCTWCEPPTPGDGRICKNDCRKGLGKRYGLLDGVSYTLERDEAMRHRVVYFHKNSMILKSWIAGQTVRKDDIASLPIWFWSSQDLSKIGSLLGSPLAADKVTKEKTMLRHARILVDMKLNGAFLELVTFVDEKGLVIE
ncbi:hypothetical protein Cgig2_010201 [Carnegiea gigantea]|uniref:DUF4283 domain-containing protein n=1 Tax=Carnegiea gigantea TaxID=171969 RepID=A0A9Q1GUQ0_9CARY|nr:hypothetical protein Cgig2_010201 [Carnegiea gigantea]